MKRRFRIPPPKQFSIEEFMKEMPPQEAHRDPSHLIWLDMEMTGLDPETCLPMEVAVIITDRELAVLTESPTWVVHHSDEVLTSMDPWCIQKFEKTGLTQRSRHSALTLEDVDAALFSFVEPWTEPKKAILCGNSIHQDRKFIDRYFPKIKAHLHYRLLDVSSVKEIVRLWQPDLLNQVKKEDKHSALDDIRESLAELQFYRQAVFKI